MNDIVCSAESDPRTVAAAMQVTCLRDRANDMQRVRVSIATEQANNGDVAAHEPIEEMDAPIVRECAHITVATVLCHRRKR